MQTKNDVLRFAGEIDIKYINLMSINSTKLNIANQIVSMEIYEDLFSPFMTANIVIRESIDLINLFPFIGEEYIEFNVVTPTIDSPIKMVMYVYKISDRMYTGDREVVYSLKCVSKEFVIDINNKIQRAISGNIAESVKKIIKEDLETKKNIIVENTSNSTKFVSNFWSPVKCLNYLCNSALNLDSSPSFLFFENRNGLNFRSIDLLLQNEAYQTFVKDNYVRTISNNTDTISSSKDLQKDYSRVLELSMPVVTDYIKDSQSGQVSSRVISYDVVTKRYFSKKYSLFNESKPFTILNKSIIHSKSALIGELSNISIIPRYWANQTGYSDTSDFKISQKRTSFFENLKKHSVKINVLGRTDYTVGQVVQLDVSSVKELTKSDDSKDKMISGKYIICAISHIIHHDKHECNIELIKNSVMR